MEVRKLKEVEDEVDKLRAKANSKVRDAEMTLRNIIEGLRSMKN